MASSVSPLLREYGHVVDDGGCFPDVQKVIAFLNPETCHALLSDASSAKAMVENLSAKARSLMDHHNAHGNVPMDLFSRASMRTRSIDVATAACHCGDDALLDAFVAALPSLYTAGCLRSDPCSVLGAVWALALDELLFRTAEREVNDPPTLDRCSCVCGPPDNDGVGRSRIVRLAAEVQLLRLSAEWMSVTVIRRCRGMMGCDGPGLSLPVFAVTCPRLLLSAVPGLVDTVLAEAAALMAAVPAADAEPHLRFLLHTLRGVVAVDPGRLRRSPGAARTLADIYRYLTADPGRGCIHEAAAVTDTVLALLCVVGGSPAALAASPTALGLLVDFCGPRPPVAVDPSAVRVAASLALHVAAQSLSSGSRTVPAPLVAARATWVSLARRARHDAAAAAVAAALVDVTSAASVSAARVGGTPATTPWSPAPFPPACLQRLTQAERCWSCGNGHMAGRPDKTLAKCSGCGVGTYCGPACARASWKADHKRSCAGWAAYGATRVAALVGLDARRGAGGAPDHGRSGAASKAARTRAGVYATVQEDLSGHWATDWSWPAARAREVEAAGLQLRDVVALVERATGAVVLAPSAAYAHWAGPAPAALLDGALGKHGGRVLRVVHRVHPPHVQVFGPRSLGLVGGAPPAEASMAA